MKVAVLGSGGGALAVAADLSRHGRETWLADLPRFAENLEPVKASRGVKVVAGWHGDVLEEVGVADGIAPATQGADLVLVVVPCFGHQAFAEALAPVLALDQTLLFLGEGSGSIVARRTFLSAGKEEVLVGETNTLPYLARPIGPGRVMVDRKSGGTLLAGIPSERTEEILDLVVDVWPFISPAESVWETVLVNFNAIDHVATIVANAATLENRTGGMLLWGEGATPSVVRLIHAVDRELLAIRKRLELKDERGYGDFLIAQGLAPDVGPELFELVRASKLVASAVPTGPRALESRYMTEDVPYALALASSIGAEVGVATPVIDGLIAMASVMLDRDFRSEGRSLHSLGLQGVGAEGLRRFAETGKWQ